MNIWDSSYSRIFTLSIVFKNQRLKYTELLLHLFLEGFTSFQVPIKILLITHLVIFVPIKLQYSGGDNCGICYWRVLQKTIKLFPFLLCGY